VIGLFALGRRRYVVRMMKYGLGELHAALKMAEAIDRARGIEPIRVEVQ
jgi:hypothetical protein